MGFSFGYFRIKEENKMTARINSADGTKDGNSTAFAPRR